MSSSIRKDIYCLSALFVLCAVFFGFRLGAAGLVDPDEPFYALSAREMFESGDWLTPRIFGEPQFEKPVFFYWVLCFFFKIFGVSEWAARAGVALGGTLTALVTYLWARVLFRKPEIAFLSAVFLLSCLQFVITSRIVLTDIWLCLFVTSAYACLAAGRSRLFFVFCALGFLTKGPVGVLLPFLGLLVYGKKVPWFSGFLIFTAIALPWYALMTVRYGPGFLSHFFIHENVRRFFVAEHAGLDRWYIYPGALWLGFFPWSMLVPFALCRYARRLLSLSVPFFAGFLFFTLAHSKLLSYVFPLFPLLALMMGRTAYALSRAVRMGRPMRPGFVVLCGLFLAVAPSLLMGIALFYDISRGLGFVRQILTAGIGFVPFFLLAFYFVWARKLRSAFFCTLAGMAVFSTLVLGWLLPEADRAFSSRSAVNWFKEEGMASENNLILASKRLVRGVRLYGRMKNVGVLSDSPDGGFYTRHAIPVYSSLKDLSQIPAKEFPVYCFLRKKEMKSLSQMLGGRFSLEILKEYPQKTIARLDRAA